MGRDMKRLQPPPMDTSFDPRARMGRDEEPSFIVLSLAGFDPRARMGRDVTSRPIA